MLAAAFEVTDYNFKRGKLEAPTKTANWVRCCTDLGYTLSHRWNCQLITTTIIWASKTDTVQMVRRWRRECIHWYFRR